MEEIALMEDAAPPSCRGEPQLFFAHAPQPFLLLVGRGFGSAVLVGVEAVGSIGGHKVRWIV